MVRFPDFLQDRKLAAIVIAIIIFLAIIAASWLFAPDYWASAGIRRDPRLETYVGELHTLVNEQHPQNLTSWHVTWLNNTAVKVAWGYTYYGRVNVTVNETERATANTTGNVGIRAVNATTNATTNQTTPAAANATANQPQLVHYDEDFIMTNFFGTKAASAYVERINSNYTLMTSKFPAGGAFERAFGKQASTFAEYKQVVGSQGKFIWQFDQLVQVGSCARTYEMPSTLSI